MAFSTSEATADKAAPTWPSGWKMLSLLGLALLLVYPLPIAMRADVRFGIALCGGILIAYAILQAARGRL